MSDGGALLRGILEAPADDGLRLIYADHLRENGREDYGDFIAVQIELARLEPKAKLADLDWALAPDASREAKRAADDLRDRERELWAAFGGPYERARAFGLPANWAAYLPGEPLPTYAPSDGAAVVTRGFVSEVRLPTSAFCGGDCGRCNVSPGVRRYATHGGDWIEDECNECSGTGHTPGAAASLFAAQPLTAVRLTDREPTLGSNGGAAWYDQSLLDAAFPGEGPHEYGLPPELYRMLGDARVRTPGGLDSGCASYLTIPAAHAALSVVCVRFGRAAAGLIV